jgi:predicted nucleotidyltransferase
MDLRRPLRVLAPTLDADILAVLARADVGMTGRAIERETGGSHGGITSALARLVKEGIVEVERIGAAHLYRLNRDHLAAPCIERLAAIPLEFIERLRKTIEAWEIHPAAAVLFGSAARGEAGTESDIDILVVRPTGVDPDAPEWREQLIGLDASATSWTGNDTRVLEYEEDEVARAGKRDAVLIEAAEEGIELFGSMGAIKRSRKRAAR